MDKSVILKLQGTWEEGFNVTLKITDNAGQFLGEIEGKLPPDPNLLQQLKNHWETEFRGIEKHDRIRPHRVIKIGSINERLQKCKDSAEKLQSSLNKWLEKTEFEPVIRLLLKKLNEGEETRFLIQTSDSNLQKLPWTEWKVLQEFNIEASLFPLKAKSPEIKSLPKISQNQDHPKVRILAILGHSDGIDVESDRKTLESLDNSEVTFLVEPQKRQINDQLWEQEWDIIFFAGHSETETQDDRKTGRLYLNSNQNILPEERSITIDELWYGLKKATEKGLRLAIFNSCDGLGLARDLNDSLIPQAIVMREVVPDKIAQAFLLYFLKSFTQGATFYTAVQEARQRLTSVRLTYQNSPTETLEFECPCATWLPVICEHPTAIPPLWKDLYKTPEPIPCPEPPQPEPPPTPVYKPWWEGVPKVALTSGICTALVMAIRWLGMLQGIELMMFDTFLKSRPLEEPDPRLLIIAIDEEDLSQYAPSTGSSIPDDVLAELIGKLKQHEPATIGLRITRDRPVGSGYESLQEQLESTPQLIATCHLGGNLEPPKAFLESPKRFGFTDYFSDTLSSDIVRRSSFYQTPNITDTQSSSCNKGEYSFSFRLAYRYLEAQNIPVYYHKKQDVWQFGHQKLKTVQSRSGGYQKIDARGEQYIINYRQIENFEEIAKTVTLRDILDDRFESDWIRDRVVLIGMNTFSAQNTFDTPYGEFNNLFVSAHVVSDLMSAAEDNRPFFWWLSQWSDFLLVFGVSGIYGLILVKAPKLSYKIAGSSFLTIIWIGGCSLIFLNGGWLPLVPTLIAAFITSVALSISKQNQTFLFASSQLLKLGSNS